jgi:multiple sugar transport system ATP-binding protein
MARIVMDEVTKVYGGNVKAVDSLSLDIADGEFMVFVGPSGCGKSTALRMIAGLEEITGGTIAIGERVVNDLPHKDRDIAMVFQNYALYPHMTVEENLAFGLQLRKMPKQEQQERVGEASRILGLDPYLKRKPAALSGGQRQRVAMGRAIVRHPQAYLMDEPLSNLDAKLRVSMRGELNRLHDRLGVTTIYVTHDQVEAMTLGTRVAVLKDGELQQVDTPQNLFEFPQNLFVAGFIGSPAMNLVEARLVRDGGPAVVFADDKLPVPDSIISERGLDRYFDQTVILGVRPSSFEDAALLSGEAREQPTMKVTVDVTEELGSEANLLFAVNAPIAQHESLRLRMAAEVSREEEEAEALAAGEGRSVWTARVNPRTTARPGRTIDLAVDNREFHYFDRDSGQAIGHQARVEAATRAEASEHA